ncbi:MAG: hypothetical protein ACYTF1_10635 [Planctomycetota bacterium]|jgi:hypothetical protein
MKPFILSAIIALLLLDTAPDDDAGRGVGEEPTLWLHFWDHQDVNDTYGRLVFRSTPLENLGRPVGYPDGMAFACTAPRVAGGTWVYGWSCRDAAGKFKETNPLRVIRCWTEDGRIFHDARTVFSDDRERWLSFANIVRRPTDGMLFMFSWSRSRLKKWTGHAMHAYASPDGTNWKRLAAPAYHDHDAFCVFWDPLSEKLINVQTTYQAWNKKYPDNIGARKRRVLSIRTSKDGVNWNPPGDLAFGREPLQERLWTPDEHDPAELELYRVCVFPHQGRYVGIVCLYAPSPQIANTRKGTRHGPGLGGQWCFSRDGRTWVRPDRETDVIDRVRFMPLPGMLRVGGMIYFYRHHDQVMAGVLEDRIFCVYCRANAEFSSRPFTVPKGDLLLNASANRYDSYVMAELRDKRNQVIPGFGKEQCVLMRLDETAHPLRWNGQSAGALAGQTVRLRLYFRNARIYQVRSKF